MPRRTIVLTSGDSEYTVVVDADVVQVDGRDVPVTAVGDGQFRIEGSRPTTAWAIASGDTRWVFLDGTAYELEVPRPGAGRRRAGGHHGSLTAPMPATVRRINVRSGDRVERGDTLIILEAMKMELPVRTAHAGIVRAVKCREGELVEAGAELIEIDEAAPPAD